MKSLRCSRALAVAAPRGRCARSRVGRRERAALDRRHRQRLGRDRARPGAALLRRLDRREDRLRRPARERGGDDEGDRRDQGAGDRGRRRPHRARLALAAVHVRAERRSSATRRSNSVSVTLRDLGKAGAVIDAAVDAGANQVSGPDLSAPTRPRSTGRRCAPRSRTRRGRRRRSRPPPVSTCAGSPTWPRAAARPAVAADGEGGAAAVDAGRAGHAARWRRRSPSPSPSRSLIAEMQTFCIIRRWSRLPFSALPASPARRRSTACSPIRGSSSSPSAPTRSPGSRPARSIPAWRGTATAPCRRSRPTTMRWRSARSSSSAARTTISSRRPARSSSTCPARTASPRSGATRCRSWRRRPAD